MKQTRTGRASIDPRTGLVLLVMANLIALGQKSIWVEAGWISALILLFAVCGCLRTAGKWLCGFFLLLMLQYYVLPASPKWIATSFSIFINYARRMLPCLMTGSLMLKTISLRAFIVGLRKWKIPQKLIIPISVTLRYFPAIREETGYIRDAMRLRSIKGIKKAEALIVPLMISAAGTAEELSAAAVTRGIENPVKKTSVLELHINMIDIISIAAAMVFVIAAFFIR